MSSFSPQDIESHFTRACEFHSQSHFAAAEKIYIELIKLLPDSSLLHYNTGLLYYETEYFEKAFFHFSQARNLAPRDPDVLFNYALCQKKLGKLQEAIASFQLFIAAYPDDLDGFYNLGNCYRELKEFEKAVITYQQILKTDPDHLPANKNLAYIYHLVGDIDNAITLYKHILVLEPGNHQAIHMIAAISGDHVAKAPTHYVKEVFNNYSETFEINLLEDLQYTVPVKLRAGIDKINYPVKSFHKCLDLGCGTGLAGVEFHLLCDHLTGVDISEKMIEKAKTKNIYNVLEVAEAISFLYKKTDEYDLVIASDFLTYIGDLDSVFKAVTPAVTEQALFCFSAENSSKPYFQLCTTGRFAHARNYIFKTAFKYGWKCLDSIETGLRKEQDDWVEGTLYFMVKF